MARPKQFDPDVALDAAIDVFREHGYAGTSAEMLVEAMQIGKQSLYNTFGGKWPLYCAALERYATAETTGHVEALAGAPTALGGVEAMMKRVVAEARLACLGTHSISEFGDAREGTEDLARIRQAAGSSLRMALAARLRQAQQDGEVAKEVDVQHAAGFLIANIAGIRLAARGGASDTELRAMARLSLQALR